MSPMPNSGVAAALGEITAPPSRQQGLHKVTHELPQEGWEPCMAEEGVMSF